MKYGQTGINLLFWCTQGVNEVYGVWGNILRQLWHEIATFNAFSVVIQAPYACKDVK